MNHHARIAPALLALCVSLFLSVDAIGAPSLKAEQVEFFEKKIRPVLVAECYECHAGTKSKGGLKLDDRAGVLKGGDSGLVIVPGDAKKSLLIRSITHENPDLKMPEKGAKLDESIIKDFVAWVNMGAPDPRDKPSDALAESSWDAALAVRKQWWSFQPVRTVSAPTPKDSKWSAHPVDRFLLTKMEERGLVPADAADRATLLRRVTFALTGLPPSLAELDAFLNDKSSDTYEKAVDRLLASPAFGERWARHWLDLMRYAETHGSEGDPEIREAWRYRDYLIRAFNADIPCDQLIREHIAGDLLSKPRFNREENLNESIIGIASLRLNEHGFQPVDTLDEQVKVVDNQIDVISKAFQGLTISCARCHDHKFDPIGQKDFYAMFGVLASSRPAQVAIDSPELLTRNRTELASLKVQVRERLATAWIASVADFGARLRGKVTDPDTADLESKVKRLQATLADLEKAGRAAAPKARGQGAFQDLVSPLAQWSFDGDSRDGIGGLHGELMGGAIIRDGRLVLDGKEAYVRSAPLKADLREKTLETWVSLANLEQVGGGVVTVETANGSIFDAIVFGEKEPKKWVAGSNNFRRSQKLDGAMESSKPSEFVHLAVVYRSDNSVTFYRNGTPYASSYTPSGEGSALQTFGAGNGRVLMGRRHTGGGRAFLAGEIDEARLYDRPLTAEQIAQSFRAGATGVSLETAMAALSTEQRDQYSKAKSELARTQQDLDAQRGKAGGAADWKRALEEASKDESNPLHALAKLSQSTDFTKSWSELATRQQVKESLRDKQTGNYRVAWDLGTNDEKQWFRSGAHLPREASPAGDFALEPAGDRIVTAIYPAGVYSHMLSQRHDGLLTSPRFKVETDFISVRALGGSGAMVRLIVDNYPLGMNSIFPRAPLDSSKSGWVRLDTNYRKGSWAYLEFGTHDSLTRPILARGQSTPLDGRSYFGVERVLFHDAKELPEEINLVTAEILKQPAPATLEEIAVRYERLLADALNAWRGNRVSEAQRALLDHLTRRNLLPNTIAALPEIASLVKEYRRLENEIPISRHVPGVVEAAAYDAPFMPRGDHLKPGDSVPRGYLQVLGTKPFFSANTPPSRHSGTSIPSGRLELANEIASAQNPLTARVMVNRVWHHLFGRGLVSTVDNFGRLGDKPSHPELLEYLAMRFVQGGWSHKKMIHFLVTSRAFQLSSEPSSQALELDPSNEWLSHFRLRRLEAESIRDSMLAVSGRMDRQMFGVPVPINNPSRRGIYLAIRRTNLSPFMEIFDAPKPFSTHGRRDTTNVPAQSLALLNDPFVVETSAHWARTLVKQTTGDTVDQRIKMMFVAAMARSPDEHEMSQSRRYITDLAVHHGIAEGDALTSERLWQDFAQSLFNLKEFIYIR